MDAFHTHPSQPVPPSAPHPHASAVLLAAGRSTRMAAALSAGAPRKPFLELAGRTLLERSCSAFAAVETVRELVIVCHADDLATTRALAASMPCAHLVRAVVEGGEERTDSVRAGVSAIDESADMVLVHDAARAFVRPTHIARVVDAIAAHGAALLAVPVRDTIKESDDGAHSTRTLERGRLWSAQTPQGFRVTRFRTVLEAALHDGFRPTDDAALWEHYVGPVALVEGDADNLKLTTPEDLVLGEALARARAAEETE